MEEYKICGYIEEYIKEGVNDARLVDILDGDTVICIIKLDIENSGCYLRFKCRLNGVDTYELRSKDVSLHKLAIDGRNYVVNRLVGVNGEDYDRENLKEYLNDNTVMIKINCYKIDKYGRLLVDIITENRMTISKELIENGLGYYYDGGRKKQ